MENLIDNNPNKQTPVPERATVHASTLTDQVNSLNNVSSDDKTRGECELNVFPTTCCCSYCSPARVTACAWHHRGSSSVLSANAGCYCTRAPAAMKCLPGLCFLPDVLLPRRVAGRKLRMQCEKILPTNTNTMVQRWRVGNVTVQTLHKQPR